MYTNEQMNSYMKERWRKRRKEAIEKLGSKYVSCGTLENLEFDHINPKTKVCSIAQASSFSEKRFWEEVNKCQLLCTGCHKLKTKDDVKRSIKHGTLTGYTYYRCRCKDCKEAGRLYKRMKAGVV